MNYLTSRGSAKGLWQQTLGSVRAGIRINLKLRRAPPKTPEMLSGCQSMVPYGPRSE
jgi:hypothetical protein